MPSGEDEVYMIGGLIPFSVNTMSIQTVSLKLLVEGDYYQRQKENLAHRPKENCPEGAVEMYSKRGGRCS